jgi:hypothetical protein
MGHSLAKLVGQPLGGITPEMNLKRLQAEIAQRKSSIDRLKLDLKDLQTVEVPRIEALILMHENDIKFLTGEVNKVNTIDITDVTPNKEG